MTKETKVLSLNNLDRWQTDIIIDITSKEVHHWKRSGGGGIDLYYEEMDNRKKRFLADSVIACAIILIGIIAAFIF
jgi:hypothetical protein